MLKELEPLVWIITALLAVVYLVPYYEMLENLYQISMIRATWQGLLNDSHWWNGPSSSDPNTGDYCRQVEVTQNIYTPPFLHSGNWLASRKKKKEPEFPPWHCRLGRSCSSGAIPGPRTFLCCKYGQKRRRRRKNYSNSTKSSQTMHCG